MRNHYNIKRYFKSRNLLLVIVLTIFSDPVFACERHDDYGFNPYMSGGFSRLHSPSSNNPPKSVTGSSRNWLTLKTPAMISARLNDKTEISIEYKKNMQVENLRLTLETMPEISVVNMVQTETDSESGRYTFTIIPAKAGTFKLTTVANAGEKDSVKTIREVIYLNVRTSS